MLARSCLPFQSVCIIRPSHKHGSNTPLDGPGAGTQNQKDYQFFMSEGFVATRLSCGG